MTGSLSSNLNTVQTQVPKVIKNLHSRADYAKNQLVQKVASLLADYDTALKAFAAKKSPTNIECAALQSQITSDILPQISSLFDQNVAMAKMGQLNTARTIMPKVAKAENRLLTELKEACEHLVAALGALTATSYIPPDTRSTQSLPSGLPDNPEPIFAIENTSEPPPALDFSAYKAETIDISPFDPHGDAGETKATIYVKTESTT